MMRTKLWGCLALGAPFFVGSALAVEAPPKPIWAKAATAIDGWCRRKNRAPQLLWSPDHHWVVEFECRGKGDDLVPHLRIRADGGNWQELLFHKGEKPDYEYQGADELMWSPDSRSFFVNGNENAYTNYMLFYHLDSTHWRASELTIKAQRDMIVSFPPCKALYHDPKDCKQIERESEFSMAGLDWTREGGALVVMAEIPPSSYYGGIMGQIQGYELRVPDGAILRRFSARQLKAAWQKSANWKIEPPDPPEYGPARRP